MRLVILHMQIIRRKPVKIFYFRIQPHLRGRQRLPDDQFLDQRDMPVIDMGIRDHMDQFPRLHIADLGNHHQKNRVLGHIPVVGRQHVIRTLVQNRVQDQSVRGGILRYIESHAVSTGIKIHLAQVLMHIDIGQDPSAVGIRLS